MNDQRPIKLNAADTAWGYDGHDTPFVERQSVILCHGMSPDLIIGGPRFVPGAQIGWWVIPQGDKRVALPSFVGHILAFEIGHPEYTLSGGENDRGVKIHEHGAIPPEDMDFIKKDGGYNRIFGTYPPGLVSKSGHYRIRPDRKPYSKMVPTILTYMLVNGHGCTYAAYGTAFPPVRDDLVIRAERLRLMGEDENGKPKEIKSCTLGKFQFASRMEKKAFTYPVPVITLAGKVGDANGPTLEEWRQAMGLRKMIKDGGDWAPIAFSDALVARAEGPPAAPPEASPHRSEIDPPPSEGGDPDWEIDDSIEF
jgi:hypothetical protein